MLTRFIPLLALVFAACGDPGVTACMARCQSLTVDPTMCQTMCTRSCDELRQSFGIDEQTCRQMQDIRPTPAPPAPPAATPPASASPDLRDRCAAFVAFTFGCGIGRPPRDPTLDIGVQTNNDLVIQQSVVAACEAGGPPYDAALIRCHEAAAADCEAYKACADQAIAARKQ